MSRPLGKLLTEWLPVQRPGTMNARAGGPPFVVPRAVEIRKDYRCGHGQASEDGNGEVLLRLVSPSAPTSRTEQTKIRDPPCGLGKASAPFSLKAHRVLRASTAGSIYVSVADSGQWPIGSDADGWISSKLYTPFQDAYRELCPLFKHGNPATCYSLQVSFTDSNSTGGRGTGHMTFAPPSNSLQAWKDNVCLISVLLYS